MKKNTFQNSIFFLLFIILVSCNENNSTTNGITATSRGTGTFKVTASDNTTKTLTLDSNNPLMSYMRINHKTIFSTNKIPTGTFIYFLQISGSNVINLYFTGNTDIGETEFEFSCLNSVAIGNVYSVNYKQEQDAGWNPWNDLIFYNWKSKDGYNAHSGGTAVTGTIVFSSFKYPGRIAGTVINYDQNGGVLTKGEFDFTSIK